MTGNESSATTRRQGDWNPQLGPDTDDLQALQAGQEVHIEVNRDTRSATVLAVIGPEALLEYAFPSGRSALRVVPRNYRRGQDPGRPYKNIGYRHLPKCWMLAVVRNKIEWLGSPQQVPDMHQTPKERYLELWPDEEYRIYQPTSAFDPPTQAQMQVAARGNARVRTRITP
jgi:hypothetical protein